MKLDRDTQKAQEAILAAQQLASGANSPVLDVEHLLAALLDDPEVQVGECDIILRARSAREMPLLDEVADLAAARGARLHVLWGHRGDGWAPSGMHVTLADLVTSLPDADVFICGPAAWAREVERTQRALLGHNSLRGFLRYLLWPRRGD